VPADPQITGGILREADAVDRPEDARSDTNTPSPVVGRLDEPASPRRILSSRR
jgi:hypothetical protein